jgi:multidrug transporter EmrE-like cation transporter
MDVVTAWISLFLAAVLNAMASAGIRYRLKTLGPIAISPPGNLIRYGFRSLFSWVMMGSLLFWILAPLIYAASLYRLNLSTAHPIFICVNFAVVFLLGATFLEERITRRKLAALGFSILGIIMVSHG